MTGGACDACLRRAWLLARLGGHLDRERANVHALLALADDELVGAVGGTKRVQLCEQLRRFDPLAARRRCERTRLETICRCNAGYPDRLRELSAPPAVLHMTGGETELRGLLDRDPVALVGARKGSPYGLELARSLARGLAASGVTVISGMANGIDAAAHAGALEGGGGTLAVLPGSAGHAYPAAKRPLLEKIRASGLAIAELPPGSAVWRWSFPARNRIIAALSAAVVVVEAAERSGALLTAAIARSLGRPVGAVPGRVTARPAAGPNELIACGATVIRGPQDVLDLLFGTGERRATRRERPPLDDVLSQLLAAIADGLDTSGAFERLDLDADAGLAALAELELCGYVRRQAGGRFTVAP